MIRIKGLTIATTCIMAAIVVSTLSVTTSEAAEWKRHPFSAPTLQAFCNSISVFAGNQNTKTATGLSGLVRAEKSLCLYPLQHAGLLISGNRDDYEQLIDEEIAQTRDTFHKEMISAGNSSRDITLKVMEQDSLQQIPIIYSINANHSDLLYTDPTMIIYNESKALMQQAIADWRTRKVALRTRPAHGPGSTRVRQ